MGKRFNPLKGRGDIDKCPTTEEEPMRLDLPDGIHDTLGDNLAHPLLQEMRRRLKT
jgi:hypothetical protein